MSTRPEGAARSWQCPAIRERRMKALRRAMRKKTVRQKIADAMRAANARKKAANAETR